MREKQTGCLITGFVGNMPLFDEKFLAILLAMLISRKPVQRRGIGEKCGFFAPPVRHQRVKESYQFVSN